MRTSQRRSKPLKANHLGVRIDDALRRRLAAEVARLKAQTGLDIPMSNLARRLLVEALDAREKKR